MLKELPTLLRRFERSRWHAALILAGLALMTSYCLVQLPGYSLRFALVALGLMLAFFCAAWAARAAAPATGESGANAAGYWLIDALAVFPVPIAFAAGLDSAIAWLFAAFWVLKLPAIAPGIARLGRVFSIEAKPLATVLVMFGLVLLFAAVAMHLLEGRIQPDAFGSVPASLWWAVVTLTTTGYGDAVPATALGRTVAGVVMICGLCVFGLLTGILATGFVEDHRRHAFLQNWNILKNVPFFRDIEPAGLIEIARMMRQWNVSEGTHIIRKGREGDCMYFIANGEVEVEVNPPVRLGPGAFFGELALLGSGVRGSNVTATLPSTLLVLEAAEFRTFAAHHPVLSATIEREAQRRAARTSIVPSGGHEDEHRMPQP